MSTRLGTFVMPDPVLTASGCAAAGRELAPFLDLTAIGAVVTKSIMLEPRSGRPTPRMAETPSGMLNSIGLQGPGVEEFIAKDLRWLRDRGIRTVVSIAGGSVQEYQKLAQRLRHEPGIAALEVNISCPNVESRGQVFACDPFSAGSVVQVVRRHTAPDVPVLAKLSPDVTDIVAIAKSVLDAGADGLSLINTLLGMVIDPDTMRPMLGGMTGGLSGPAIRPVAVRAVWQVHAAHPRVPILGMGGIRTGQDAFEFLLAGASAVSVGTAVFNDPHAPARISAELHDILAARGFARLSDAVGLGHTMQARHVAAMDARACRRSQEDSHESDRSPLALDRVALDARTAPPSWRGPRPPPRTSPVMKVGLETLPARRCPRGRRRPGGGSRAVALFLDLKLHDIPNTVAGAARSIAELAPEYLTVHASGGPAMVAAAAEALPGTRITAVTVLTSLSEADLEAVGLRGPALDAAVRLAVMAVAAGARAIVCSPREVAAIRAAVPGRNHPDHARRAPGHRRGKRGRRPVPGGHPGAGPRRRGRPPRDRPAHHGRGRPR